MKLDLDALGLGGLGHGHIISDLPPTVKRLFIFFYSLAFISRYGKMPAALARGG